MNPSIFKFYWLVVGYIYKKMFNEKMSIDGVNFFKNISYVGFGTLISTFFSITFNVLRAYPKSPAALNVIHAHAKCSIAR
jgi:hypothetical protein